MRKELIPLLLVFIGIYSTFSCTSENSERISADWRVLNADQKDPKNYRRLEFSNVSICIPEYMTPTDTGYPNEWHYDAISKGESVEIKEITKDKLVAKGFDLKGFYLSSIEEYCAKTKSYKIISSDSVLLNGRRTYYSEMEVRHYGNPMNSICNVAVLEAENSYYFVEISKVVNGQNAEEAFFNVLLKGLIVNASVEKIIAH